MIKKEVVFVLLCTLTLFTSSCTTPSDGPDLAVEDGGSGTISSLSKTKLANQQSLTSSTDVFISFLDAPPLVKRGERYSVSWNASNMSAQSSLLMDIEPRSGEEDRTSAYSTVIPAQSTDELFTAFFLVPQDAQTIYLAAALETPQGWVVSDELMIPVIIPVGVEVIINLQENCSPTPETKTIETTEESLRLFFMTNTSSTCQVTLADEVFTVTKESPAVSERLLSMGETNYTSVKINE